MKFSLNKIFCLLHLVENGECTEEEEVHTPHLYPEVHAFKRLMRQEQRLGGYARLDMGLKEAL